jgi:hypothetical protein
MQKSLHLLALLDTCKARLLRHLLQPSRILLLQLIVAGDIAAADKEDVARFELDILVFGDGKQLRRRNGVVAEGFVRTTLLLRPGVVVEQDAATGNAMVGDSVDAAASAYGRLIRQDVGPSRTSRYNIEEMDKRTRLDLLRSQVVIEPVDFEIPKMAESVPLTAGLRVHVIVVVEYARAVGVHLDLVLECGAVEGGLFR